MEAAENLIGLLQNKRYMYIESTMHSCIPNFAVLGCQTILRLDSHQRPSSRREVMETQSYTQLNYFTTTIRRKSLSLQLDSSPCGEEV